MRFDVLRKELQSIIDEPMMTAELYTRRNEVMAAMDAIIDNSIKRGEFNV